MPRSFPFVARASTDGQATGNVAGRGQNTADRIAAVGSPNRRAERPNSGPELDAELDGTDCRSRWDGQTARNSAACFWQRALPPLIAY